jgi:DnaK suppressor protein
MGKRTATPPDLRRQYARVEAEYAAAIERHRLLMRDLSRDSAGDDIVDIGTKVAVSDQDEAELRFITDRRDQMARAVHRLDAGGYGLCETCGQPIPAERLALFPAATSCVACKRDAERLARR